jgi:Ca-activated chloride channel homolog
MSSIRHRNLFFKLHYLPPIGVIMDTVLIMQCWPIMAIILALSGSVWAQSGRVTGYSESGSTRILMPLAPSNQKTQAATETGFERVPTDLVTIPVRIAARNGKPVHNVLKSEFKIFENDVEQEIAYFSNDEQPFTVALLLDMSYSTVFKLDDIRTAARIFTFKLRERDRVTVISFDEKARVLCNPTNDRRVLQLAIEGATIGSGTALYDTLDSVLTEGFSGIAGRKAIVVLTDGVDTRSTRADARSIATRLGAEDVIVYSLQYNTFADVRKSRQKVAEVRFDEADRPYVVPKPPEKGEREVDYKAARDFLKSISEQTGGRVYRVSLMTNLNESFSNIADELRKIYSLGYYPADDRHPGAVYDIKVRVFRPDLKITARNHYFGK